MRVLCIAAPADVWQYGTLYILFTTFTFVFENHYGFSSSTVGLVYLGTGIGMFFGLAGLIASSDRILKRLGTKNGGVYKPEFRLPPLMYTSWTLPLGLFMYGWAVQYHVSCRKFMLGNVLTCADTLDSAIDRYRFLRWRSGHELHGDEHVSRRYVYPLCRLRDSCNDRSACHFRRCASTCGSADVQCTWAGLGQ